MSVATENSADANAIRRPATRLSIYLNDHLAGSTLGVELVKRASSESAAIGARSVRPGSPRRSAA